MAHPGPLFREFIGAAVSKRYPNDSIGLRFSDRPFVIASPERHQFNHEAGGWGLFMDSPESVVSEIAAHNMKVPFAALHHKAAPIEVAHSVGIVSGDANLGA